MSFEKIKKKIDYSKTNIGVELECFIIDIDTLENISLPETQKIFATLEQKYGWVPKKAPTNEEIHSVSKVMGNYPMVIKLDVTYSIFEIMTLYPVPSLEILEDLHKKTFFDLRWALKENNLMIWPFGVAPASTFLLKLPRKTKVEIINDMFYRLMTKFDDVDRFAHMTSHQMNIDVPFKKMLPFINALYKNLGKIIEKFANSSVYANGILYKEGRYYWWNDSNPNLQTEDYIYGQTHIFPPEEFRSWNHFFDWNFKGWPFVIRNGWPYCATPDFFVSTHKFIKEGKMKVLDENGKKVEVNFEKGDIEDLLKMSWIDFRPHFDFDQSYTLEEFLEYYNRKDLDGFFQKYCKHSWLEIRPCSPHFEENAMVIPRYFYDIVKNIDQYIKDSKKISWEEARISRDKAIGYIK